MDVAGLGRFAFHGEHYSANTMRLSILGRESLDTLQQWAEACHFESNRRPRASWDRTGGPASVDPSHPSADRDPVAHPRIPAGQAMFVGVPNTDRPTPVWGAEPYPHERLRREFKVVPVS